MNGQKSEIWMKVRRPEQLRYVRSPYLVFSMIDTKLKMQNFTFPEIVVRIFAISVNYLRQDLMWNGLLRVKPSS